MFTEKNLICDIRALGIEDGDLLTVHTSLKSIGEIDGNGKSGAEVVIDALTW
jgi:aminoglycoside N3'-acetyltransferase